MIQLVFDAVDARGGARRASRSRSATASTRARSGPTGATTSSSSSTARHPVVHPAAGSHANFFDEALYLGSSAAEGVGCDDTRGPTFDVRPVVRTIPSDAAEATRRVSVDRVRGPLGRAAAGVLQRPDRPEPEDPVDAADRVVARTGAIGATPFRRAASSGTRRPTSSAARSRTGSTALVRLVDHPLGVRLARGRRSPCSS